MSLIEAMSHHIRGEGKVMAVNRDILKADAVKEGIHEVIVIVIDAHGNEPNAVVMAHAGVSIALDLALVIASVGISVSEVKVVSEVVLAHSYAKVLFVPEGDVVKAMRNPDGSDIKSVDVKVGDNTVAVGIH